MWFRHDFRHVMKLPAKKDEILAAFIGAGRPLGRGACAPLAEIVR
jgi:hypothetical protein